MSESEFSDIDDRGELSEQDLVIAALVGRYVERRERLTPPQVDDLAAVAAEFGETAAERLRGLIAFYEAMRAAER